MSKTRFYLIRHGESIGNRYKIILGHTDLDLTEQGYEQAKRTAEELSDVDFDAVYSSDLMRAYNTAAPHAALRNMEIIPDKNLREIYVGDWENTSRDKIRELFGDMYDKGFVDSFGVFKFPGGESTQEAADRMYEEIELIAKKEQGKTVLLASHAAAIRAFFGKIMKINPEDIASTIPFPSNASYSTFEYENGVFTPLEYSVDGHLAELFTTWTR